MYNVYSESKAAIAERAIRTIRENLNRRAAYLNRYVWIDYLPILVKRLNNTISASTNFAPSKVGVVEDAIIFHKNHDPNIDYEKKESKFKINDLVRISRKRNIFEKGTNTAYTKEIFKIDSLKWDKGIYVYYLTDMKNERVIGAFYEQELVRVSQLPS